MAIVDAGAIIAVVVGAGAQAVTGIGFSLVCAPLLTLALGGADGVRTANLLAIVVNLLLLRHEWRAVSVRSVLLLLVPATVAAALTSVVLGRADPRALSLACGLIVLVAVGLLASGRRAAGVSGPAGALAAGAVSGAMNVVGGVGGPAVAGYAVNADWPLSTARATLSAYFLGINVVSVASRGTPRLSLVLLAGLAAAVVVGFTAGRLLGARTGTSRIRSGTLALAALGAAATVVQALV